MPPHNHPKVTALLPAPFDITRSILHRDAAVIVLNKPAGIAVHAGSGKSNALDQHFAALRFGLDRDPQLAHRLDKDTSGCLVLGRTREALARLGKLFQRGLIGKTYWAIVAGVPVVAEGVIDQPLARRSADRRSWIMKPVSADAPEAETAITDYRVLKAGDGLSLVEFRPRTGRTHQLRVHADAMGWPIAGDPIYGGDRARAIARHLQLHARRIIVPQPGHLPPLDVTAPLPEHMQPLLRLIGFDPDTTEGAQA